jgi:predicted nucleic acid-binding protein
MPSHFTVLYDASVFYPAPLRDLLMELATAGLFRAKWSEQIQEEWIESLLKKRSDLNRERLERTKKIANKAVPDCLVEGYKPLIEGLKLPDINDRHVLAAAIHCNAQVIVTYNLKDFPKESLQSFEIEAQHPDVFLRHIIDLAPPRFLEAIKEIRGRLNNPPVSAQAYLDRLLNQHELPLTFAFLKQYINLI